MANPNNKFGFRPVGRLSGGPYGVSEYGKPASDGNYAIFMNDLVIQAAVSVASPGGNPSPGCASAQGQTAGAISFLGSSLNYGAISTATLHSVADDPQTIFIAQMDDATVTSAASYCSKNANFLTGAGNATTKQSTMSINHTGTATTSSLDLHLIKISNIVPNAEGAYGIFEVLINKHARAGQMAGV